MVNIMKKYIVIAVAIVALGATVGVSACQQNNNKDTDSATNNYSAKMVSGDCSGSERTITEFLEKTLKGEIATLNIENDYDGRLVDEIISFNGNNYTFAGEGSVGRYEYFYKVSGANPNAGTIGTQYILADEKYTYEQIFQSMFSSDSNDWLEYHMVCWKVS
jgi:hypothetical protein